MPNNGDIREDGFVWRSGCWRSPQGLDTRLKYINKYTKKNRSFCSDFKGRDCGKATAACELLVRADLSKRGFEVTVPVSPTARHDLHAEFPSVGWLGIQVKAATKNARTGFMRAGDSKRCESPILALVFLPTNEIVYREGLGSLPPELQE